MSRSEKKTIPAKKARPVTIATGSVTGTSSSPSSARSSPATNTSKWEAASGASRTNNQSRDFASSPPTVHSARARLGGEGSQNEKNTPPRTRVSALQSSHRPRTLTVDEVDKPATPTDESQKTQWRLSATYTLPPIQDNDFVTPLTTSLSSNEAIETALQAYVKQFSKTNPSNSSKCFTFDRAMMLYAIVKNLGRFSFNATTGRTVTFYPVPSISLLQLFFRRLSRSPLRSPTTGEKKRRRKLTLKEHSTGLKMKLNKRLLFACLAFVKFCGCH